MTLSQRIAATNLVGIPTSEVHSLLRRYVSEISASAVLNLATGRAGVRGDTIRWSQAPSVLIELEAGLRVFLRDSTKNADCTTQLRRLLSGKTAASSPSVRSFVIRIDTESDILIARRTGSELCKELGFTHVQLTKVATAISELARNIVHYANHGEIALKVVDNGKRGIEVIARDQGPGIPNLEAILAGKYQSKRGLGMGLRGTSRLVDFFDVKTTPGQGTQVTIRAFVR